MTRRCSHCSNNRTCPTRVGSLSLSASSSSLAGACSPSSGSGWVKLFGVRLTDGSFIKKSVSMGNLSSAFHHHSYNPDSPSSDHLKDPADDGGYLSDDPNDHAGCASSTGPRLDRERKKGVPWTEEEHRLFLIGLQKLGKGDWRGIAHNFVASRTPTQVASHAQKHFIRQSNATRRKRRSSLFDMVPDRVTDPQPVQEEREVQSSQARETDKADAIPSLDLSLKSEYEPMETSCSEPVVESDKSGMGSNDPGENSVGSNGFRAIVQATSEFPSFVPGFYPAYVPVPFAFWPMDCLPPGAKVPETSQHKVLRPMPILPKEHVNVDEHVGITYLSLGETERSQREPSSLSLKLVGVSSRQSAFHANAPVSTPELSNGKGSPVQAV